MSLKCVVIDNELPAIELLTKFIKSCPALRLLQTFDDVITGGEFLRNNRVDLLFIELSMPANTAIKLVKSISDKLMIIFTIAGKRLAPEVLEMDVLDYLVKPFIFDRFARAIDKATERRHLITPQSQTGEAIYVRSTYHLVKINLNDIEYIESMENYVKIHLSNDEPVMALMPLKIMNDRLPQEKFARIHRSYIIPLDKIKYIGNKKIKLNAAELPVSDSYLATIKELVNK